MAKVTLSSSDGSIFQVDPVILHQSKFIHSIIQDSGMQQKISFPNINSKTLQKVISYCQYHKDKLPAEIPRPLVSNTLSGVVDPWDEQLIDIKDQQEMLQLVLASDYLEVDSLRRLAAAKLATAFKGKTTEQMRQILGVQNDYSAEQEKEIRENYKWIEEIQKQQKKEEQQQDSFTQEEQQEQNCQDEEDQQPDNEEK